MGVGDSNSENPGVPGGGGFAIWKTPGTPGVGDWDFRGVWKTLVISTVGKNLQTQKGFVNIKWNVPIRSDSSFQTFRWFQVRANTDGCKKLITLFEKCYNDLLDRQSSGRGNDGEVFVYLADFQAKSWRRFLREKRWLNFCSRVYACAVTNY